MKKLVSACLLIALVCSLCATGVFASALSPEELYEKYAPVIDALEAEDYDAAVEAIDALQPVVEYEAVEITPENFFDYFEIQQGEAQKVTMRDGEERILPGGLEVVMKEGVRERLNRKDSTLTIGVKAKKDFYRAKIDAETGEVKLGDKMDSKDKKALKKSASWWESKVDTQIEVFYGDGYFNSWLDSDAFWYKDKQYNYWTNEPAQLGSKTKYYQVVYRDIELVNAVGTLYLAPEV